MRKILAGCLLLISVAVLAQEGSRDELRNTPVSTGVKQHEVLADYGDPFINGLIIGFSPFGHHDPSYGGTDWFGRNTYSDDISIPGTFSLSYHSRIGRHKWLWLGGVFSFTGAFGGSVYDSYTNELISRGSGYLFGLAPSIRFSFVNSDVVTLYGGLSLGVIGTRSYAVSHRYNTEFYPYVQLTYFGISVGGNLFGNLELGLGMKGFINVGMGYRF